MKKRRSLFQKAVSLFTGFLLIFQSLTPSIFISSKVFAEDSTPPEVTTTESPTPNPTEIIEPTQTVTPIETPEITPTIVPSKTETPAPTINVTPTIIPTIAVVPTESTEQPKENSPPATNDNPSSSNPTTTPTATITPEPTITNTPSEIGELQATILKNIKSETLDLDGVNPDGSASLSTDKADYAPTDTAIITGKDFSANKTYQLTISSTDNPATSTTVDVTMDESGTFIYAYQLDGIYRPNYNVEVKENNRTVATTTFTDSRWVFDAKINGGTSATVFPNDLVTANVQVMTWWGLLDPNDNWRSTSYQLNSETPVCINTPNHNGTGIYADSFNFNAPLSVGTYDLTFKAFANNSCNSGTLNFSFTLPNALTVQTDTIAPVITLIGDNPQTIEAGTPYIELGATVSDNRDVLTPTITHSVNTNSVGTYYVYYNAIDTAGNAAEEQIRTVQVVDTTAPSVPSNGAPHNTTIPTNNFDFTWNASNDYSSVSYEFQSSLNPSQTDNVLTTGLWKSGILPTNMIHSSGAPDGTWYWQVRAKDSFGYTSAWSPIWNVTLDKIAPTVDLVFPTPSTSANSFQAVFSENVNQTDTENPANYFLNNWPGAGGTGDLVDDASIMYDAPSKTATITFTNSDWYISPEQQWGIQNIHDLAGNIQQTNPYTEYSTTPTPPVTTDSGIDTNWHNTPVTVTLTCSDINGSGCKKTYYTTDGTTPTTASPSGNSFTLSIAGTYTIKYFSIDNAGNVESVKTAANSVKIDTTSPFVEITAPTVSLTNSTSIAIKGTVTDNNPHHYWLVIQNSGGTTVAGPGTVNNSNSFTDQLLFTWNTTSVPDGTYTIKLEARDAADNKTTQSVTSKTITIDKTNPGKPTITSPTVEQYFKTQPIVNRWTAISDTSGIKQYAVEYIYDDGHTFSGGPNRYTTATSRNHTPNINEQGGVTIRVRAEDNAGNIGEWSDPIHYTYDATAPMITIDAYTTAQTNQNITVTASTNEGTLNTTSHVFTENGSFTFTAVDLAGNTSSKTVTITNIDKIKPTTPTGLQFKNPNLSCGAITNIKTVTIDWTDSTDDVDIAGYDYSINYPLPSGGRGTWNTFFTQSQYRGSLNEGVHNIQVRAKDTAGNVSDWTPLCGITYDSISPALTEQTPFEGWYNTNQTATFTYSDANGVVSGGDVSCDITTEGANQTCSVTPNVCDAAGNCNTTPVTSNSANIDFTLPESIITLPENEYSGSTIYTNVWDGSIRGTAEDMLSGIEGVQVSIQNSLGQYFDGTTFIDTENKILLDTTFTEGNWEYTGLTAPLEDSYIIQSHAIDAAGNVENTYEITVILDKTIPEVTLSINPTIGDGENGWYKTQPEISLTATDEHIDKIEYQWDSETGEWTTYTSPFKPTTEGAHVLYYRALDLASNYSDTGIKNIAWDNTALEKAPQNVSVSPNPSNGKNVKVTWEAATDNTGVDHYTITWQKDGVGERGTNVSETTREYIIPDTLTEGVWNVKVTAVDKAGFTADASANATVDLTAPAAPTLALTGTGVGSVSLAWNAVEGAVDYSVWYGTTAGTYDYAAHVGNVTSYTIQGLGAGTYYVVVAAYDNVVNRSAFSNEVNTGGVIEGAPGATTGPAEGFQPAGSVLGSETVNPETSGQTLGSTTTAPSFSWWFILIGLLLIIIALYIYYRQRRKNR